MAEESIYHSLSLQVPCFFCGKQTSYAFFWETDDFGLLVERRPCCRDCENENKVHLFRWGSEGPDFLTMPA